MEEKCPYVREKMGTNFLVSPNLMDFTAFSHAMGNWWGNPCISHIIKYTTECKSNGKKAPILWVKYEYQFSRFSKYDEFCRIFPENQFFRLFPFDEISYYFTCLGKLTSKPVHFPYVEVHNRMGSNGKNHLFYGKSMGTNFPGISHLMGFTML